jgi:integrase
LATSGRLKLLRAAPGVDAAGAVFESMLAGWRDQQLARNLNLATIEARERVVRRFRSHADSWPWQWLPGASVRVGGGHADGRSSRSLDGPQLRAGRGQFLRVRERSRLWVGRGVPGLFRFGTVADLPAGQHGDAHHGLRGSAHIDGPLTRSELQALFDAADDHVEEVRARGRKGWVAAFRDATMLKVAYAWGLRRRELRMLEVADFGPIPKRMSSADTVCATCAGAKRPREARLDGAAC